MKIKVAWILFLGMRIMGYPNTGVATFNWIVGNDNISGTYPATISGGGDILNTSHTVLE